MSEHDSLENKSKTKKKKKKNTQPPSRCVNESQHILPLVLMLENEILLLIFIYICVCVLCSLRVAFVSVCCLSEDQVRLPKR